MTSPDATFPNPLKIPRLIVYVSGGVVQGVIADGPGAEVMIVDYDNEESTGPVGRAFEKVEIRPGLFAATIAGKEEDYQEERSPAIA